MLSPSRERPGPPGSQGLIEGLRSSGPHSVICWEVCTGAHGPISDTRGFEIQTLGKLLDLRLSSWIFRIQYVLS